MATDAELRALVDAEIEANPAGVTVDEHRDRRVEQAPLKDLLEARGVLAARAQRSGGMFARIRTNPPGSTGGRV